MSKTKGQYDWTEADKWINENKSGTYTEFSKAISDFPFTDATFYNRKTKLLNGKKHSSTSQYRNYSVRTLYQTLTTIPRTDVSDAELKGMNRMLELLQKFTKVKIEIIQIANPPQIEIRQMQTR